KPCTEQSACLVCRVFGFVHSDYSWAGKVRFHDTTPAAVKWAKLAVSRDWGRGADDGGSGWRVFPHREVKLPLGNLRCAAEGSKFQFRIDYLNLDPEEYAVLKFALTLRYGDIVLCHKLGYQKAQGLGSVKVSIPSDKSPPIGAEIRPYIEQP